MQASIQPIEKTNSFMQNIKPQCKTSKHFAYKFIKQPKNSNSLQKNVPSTMNPSVKISEKNGENVGRRGNQDNLLTQKQASKLGMLTVTRRKMKSKDDNRSVSRMFKQQVVVHTRAKQQWRSESNNMLMQVLRMKQHMHNHTGEKLYTSARFAIKIFHRWLH